MLQPTPLHPAPAPDPGPLRSEEDELRGILPIRIGSELRNVPTLKRVHSREWKQIAARRIAGIDLPDGDAADLLAELAVTTDDVFFDLVLEFDRTGVLGGREWLEQNADDRDIHEAFQAMARSVSPLVDDPIAAFSRQIGVTLALAFARLGDPSAAPDLESSTSGSSGSADSLPSESMPSSPTNSSSDSGSTGKRTRNARRRSNSN